MSLEEVSNRNLVRYFMEEITHLRLDEITYGGRRQLMKQGILVRSRGNARIKLSEYGLRLLEEVKRIE